MPHNAPQTVKASRKDSLAENQPQPPLPREYAPRFESDGELKTFIDEKELIRRLHISRRTAFNWIQQGKLPVVAINRRKLYHWKSVTDALLRIQKGAVES